MSEQTGTGTGTVMLRILTGLMLFLCFVLADMTDYRIFDLSTTEIAAGIKAGIQTKDDYTNLEKYVMMLFADENTVF